MAAKFKWGKTAWKGLKSFLVAGGAVLITKLSYDYAAANLENSDPETIAAIVALILSMIAGGGSAAKNVIKNADKPGNPFGDVPVSRFPVILAMLGAACLAPLAGCVTTTQPDGTTTTQMDREMVAVLLPVVTDMVDRYIAAQAAADEAEAARRAEQLAYQRELIATLIGDEALRQTLLDMIDGAFRSAEAPLITAPGT